MLKPKLSPSLPTLSFHSYFPLNFSHHLLSFLGERNLELRSDLVEGLTKSYKSAGSKLESSTFHLSRAQTAALVIHSFIHLYGYALINLKLRHTSPPPLPQQPTAFDCCLFFEGWGSVSSPIQVFYLLIWRLKL